MFDLFLDEVVDFLLVCGEVGVLEVVVGSLVEILEATKDSIDDGDYSKEKNGKYEDIKEIHFEPPQP